MTRSRSELAALIDHTLLKPEATPADVAAVCIEANDYGVAAVCINPSMLPLPMDAVHESIAVATVIGFPSGAVDARIKAAEAALAFAAGASEIDMVVNLGAVKSADWDGVEADIGEVCTAVPFALVKVIIESAVLTPEEITRCCAIAESAGADYVKTSTGFHPAGGATVEAIRLMKAAVGDRLGIKASGGIRDLATATAMLDAGATRLGTSATAAILADLR